MYFTGLKYNNFIYYILHYYSFLLDKIKQKGNRNSNNIILPDARLLQTWKYKIV